ncbi:MAG: hypothetical protein J5737_05480 [Bacteroidales bacterium]|nr:hypothetical protein [Bacteroidales bacterium]
MKIYTKSYILQDFKSRTTRIVLDGPQSLISSLREDATSIWTVSPYEFCTPAQYEKLKGDPFSYFLRPVSSKGIISLVLTKGGRDHELLSVPVAGDNCFDSLQYMAAFLSIVQDYAESAISSERVAYAGVPGVRKCRPAGTRLVRDPQEALAAFRAGDETAAVEIFISPDGTANTRPRYRYRVNAGNYKLYSFVKL